MAHAARKRWIVACVLLLLACLGGVVSVVATSSRDTETGAPDRAPRDDARDGARGTAHAPRERRRVDADARNDDAAPPAETLGGRGAEGRGENAPPPAGAAPVAVAVPGGVAPEVVRVTTADGIPVAGARVEIRQEPEVAWPADHAAVLATMLAEPPVVAQGLTDDSGGVRLPELAQGRRLRVSVSRSGHGTASVRHFGGPGLSVELGAAHDVAGTVRFLGAAPEAGLLVLLAQGAGPPRVVARTATDADGRFALSGVAEGSYGVWVAWPGGLPITAGVLAVPGDSLPEVHVRCAGTFTGVVRRAATGDAVAGVRVLALGTNGYLGQATTDDNGAYRLRLLGDDVVKRLTAWKEGLVEVALRECPVTVGPGVERVADFDVYAGGSVSGVVRGPSGPVAGANVQVWTADGRYITNAMTKTGADGSYTVPGLQPGLAHVLVTCDEGLVHPGQPREGDRWRALLESDLDPRCAVTVEDGGNARLDVTLEESGKRAIAAR